MSLAEQVEVVEGGLKRSGLDKVLEYIFELEDMLEAERMDLIENLKEWTADRKKLVDSITVDEFQKLKSRFETS